MWYSRYRKALAYTRNKNCKEKMQIKERKEKNMNAFLHMAHVGGVWFYWFNDDSSNKHFYRAYVNFEKEMCEIPKHWSVLEGVRTKSEAKTKLKILFPNYVPIHTLPYHEGSRTPGTEGSRK